MKSKVIFCVLLFCSKIVDSISQSEDLVVQRGTPLANWQVHQNAPNAQYLNTEYTQTLNLNQEENTQDYYKNQGRYNYDNNGYNRSPVAPPSGDELLVSYDSPADGRRLDSYPSRVESFPSRTVSQPGFGRQQYRNQNWRSQNRYANSVPSTVLIPDDERPLVNTVQEPYRDPVHYLQPKYVPSAKRRFHEPDGSYLRSSVPVPYENFNEDHVAASEVKARQSGGQRYAQNFAPQSRIYNEAPAVIAKDPLIDQSENLGFAKEIFRSRPDLSNASPIVNYDSDPAYTSAAENYSLDSGPINSPVRHESHREGQATPSELKLRPIVDRRHVQSQIDQSANIKYLENYKSGSRLSYSAPITDFKVGFPVLSEANNYSLDSGASNGPVRHESYRERQAAPSEVKIRPVEDRRHVQSFASQSKITYDAAPLVVARDTLTDQSNIKYNILEKYQSQSPLSNTEPIYTEPITNSNDGSSVITQADNDSSDSGASNGPIHYESKREDQTATSDAKTRFFKNRKYVHSLLPPQSGINYNEDTIVVATDTLKDQTENFEYLGNYKSGSDLSNTAPITSHGDGFPLIFEADNNNSDYLPSNLARVNNKKEAPVPSSKTKSEKPLARRYAKKYILPTSSDFEWSNIARDASFNDEVTETIQVKSEKYETDSSSDNKPKESVPIKTYTGASSAPTDTDLSNSGSNKPENSNAHHGSTIPTPSKTNPKQNVYQKLSSGITEFNLRSLVANPDIQNILAGSNKRYVVVHPNGTVEYLDNLDLDSHQSPKLRLVHTKRKNIEDSESNGVLTPQLPENLPNSIAPAPVDEYPVPSNNQPADDKKPTPLHVYHSKPADTYSSKLSPPLKDLPAADFSNLKPLPQPEKQPADINNSKPSFIIPPAGDGNSTTTNEDQSAQNDNLKPFRTPQDVNVIRDKDHVKPLTPQVNQPVVDRYSKPLPQVGNRLASDDSSKLLTSEEDQPADDEPKDENNTTPLSPNERQPALVKKLKHSFVKYLANDNNSNPLLKNENQPEDERPSHPYRRQPGYRYRSKHLHVTADNNNSEPSSPGENQPSNHNPSNEHHSEDETESTSLLLNKKQPAHRNKPKQSEVIPPGDNNSDTSAPDEKQPLDNSNFTPLASNKKPSGDDTDTKTSSQYKTQSVYHYESKSNESPVYELADNNTSNPSSLDENQPEHDQELNPLLPDENQPTDESQSGDDKDIKPVQPNQRHPAHHKKSKSNHSRENKPADHNNRKQLPLNQEQPGDDIKSKPLPVPATQSANDTNSKRSFGDQSADDDSNPSSPGENLTDDQESNPLLRDENQPTDENQSGDDKDIKPVRPNQRQPARHKKSKTNHPRENKPADHNIMKQLPLNQEQPGDDTKSKPLPVPATQSANDTNSKHSLGDQSADDDSNPSSPGDNLTDDQESNPLLLDENQPTDENQSGDDKDIKPVRPNQRHPAHHKKSKSNHPRENKPADHNITKQLPLNQEQPGDDIRSKPLPVPATQSANDTNSKHSLGDQSADDDSNPSSPGDNLTDDEESNPLLPDENQPTDENQSRDDKDIKPVQPNQRHPAHHKKSKSNHSRENKPADHNNRKQLPLNQEQPGDDIKSKPLPVPATQSANDTKSKHSLGDQSVDDNSNTDENQPEEKKNNPLRPNEHQPVNDLTSTTTPAGAGINYDQTSSTTLSPIVPNYATSPKPQVIKTHKRKHIRRKSTTNSPAVSTTPSPDDTVADQIITLSPIEQATDNVSDVPLVTTTTTTTRPVKTSDKSDINDTNNKQDDVQDDTTQKYSTTTVAPSSSASPTDIISDDKTTRIIENKNTQTDDKTIVDQANGQKAVYNSSELFDTNTDVPAESDDYSSITASPSVQNDVNTGDASGDNSSELEQSETDVTITLSSSTTIDSEDEIITINIEVSESTDDADSSSNDKSLVINIDTNDDSDDDSKTPTPDCKKDRNSDDGRGKNVEIDMSNLKGEPTMWIRTTNQDFIDKLTAKNETEFDVIYFFHIDNQPAIEREKATTIYCNGTVVIETKEISYAHKDDPTPTIVKTTKIMQIEDYEEE